LRALLILLVPIVSLPLSGNFFGINYWYFEKLSTGERKLVAEKLKELRVDTVRIGGLWYDAKGMKTWVLEDFFSLCEDLHATPIVQIPLNGHTVDEMLNFVEKVRTMYRGRIIWSVGNEPDIYQDVGFSWIKRESREEVLGKMKEFLRKFDKGDDILILPDLSHRWRPWMMGSWTKHFLDLPFDVFSVHRYPFRYVFGYGQIVEDVTNFTAEMLKLKRFLKKPVALTEINLSWDWNFHGEFSPEGEYAALWLVSIYVRSMVLDIWNVSVWSTVNDSSLSLLIVKDGKVEERPSFKALRVFKGISGDLKDHHFSKYLDWILIGNSLIVVNRYEKEVSVKTEGGILKVPPMSVTRYDNGVKVFEWRVGM